MRTAPAIAAITLGLGLALALPTRDANAQSRNCIDTLAGMPEYSRFVGAVARASLINDVHNMQNITLFVPTNTAIEQAPPGLVDRLFPRGNEGAREADPVLAGAALSAHIVEGRLPAAALATGVRVRTMAGTTISTTVPPGTERAVVITAGEGVSAKITQADVPCNNGVIHGIDRVLIR